MNASILIAGFGGQGILFAGKYLAHSGMMEGRNISWLPSYGPEMRGGTANCSVIISDSPVGSPIITNPDVLVAMNLPSLDKYENAVVPGGAIFVDSALIGRKVARTDVSVHYIPATRMASEAGFPTLANMIMLGRLIKETGVVDYENTPKVLAEVVPASKPELRELNARALDMGSAYTA